MHNPKDNNKNTRLSLSTLIFLITSVLVFFGAPAKANIETYAPLKFKQLSIEQGLSQSLVYSMEQDDLGFIWIATQDGLSRYDGQELLHYRNDATNTTSLVNNFVRVIFIDSNNHVWVGTQGGLSKYNHQTDDFKNFYSIKNDVNSLKDEIIWAIFEDKQKQIWVSTSKGLHKYDPLKDNFKRINLNSFDAKVTEIKSIFQDDNNNLWLGTFENSLFILNNKQTYISPINGENKWKLNIPAKNIFEIKKIEQQYWVASNKGVYVVDKNYKLVKIITPNLPIQDTKKPLSVRSIHKIDDEHVWFGTERGLFQYNLSTDSLYPVKMSTNDATTPPTDFIFKITNDDAGTIWLSTRYSGLLSFNTVSRLFHNYLTDDTSAEKHVKSFTEFSDQELWVATQYQGLYYLKPNNSDLLYKADIDLDSQIASIHADGHDTLWIITQDSKLFKYHRKNKAIVEYPNWLEELKGKISRVGFQLIDGNFWFSTQNSSIVKYSIKNKSLQEFTIPNINPNETVFLAGINDKNQIWTHTKQNELYLFDIYTEKFSLLRLPDNPAFNDNSLFGVYENDEYIWLTFQGQGVLSYNTTTNQYTEFNEKLGLANNSISDLVLDEQNGAWVSTNRGISYLNQKSNKTINYGSNQGVINGEFYTFSFLKNQNGKIFFGGTNGFNSFFPNDISSQSEFISTPINHHFSIENKRLPISQPDIENAIPNNLYLMDELTIEYDKTPFTIEFVAPNSTYPEEVKYRYQLKGIDENWIYTSADNRRATYTKLPHGSYQFLVEAITNKVDIKKSGKPLTITILPPWWHSNLAYFIYCLIFAGIILHFYKQAQDKEKTNKQIKESEERLKLALWGSGDEMWDWNIVTNQMYRSNIWGILDFPKGKEQTEGKNDSSENSNIHPQDYPRVKQLLDDHKANKTEHYEAAYRVRNKNGEWMWVLDRGKIVERDSDDSPIRMTGTLKDISQIKQTEESLKLFAKCIENISDAVVIYDTNFLTVDCNLSYQRITSQTRSESLGSPLTFKVYPESFLHNLKKNLVHHGSWQGEVESLRPDGSTYLIDITLDIIRDENNKISHYVGVFSDITKRKETEAELRKLANSDTLTGLPNRSFFQATQSQLVAQDVEHALLVFDLDNFKKINDSIGHQVGDVLLCKVTERIATVGNIKDTCYRLGGDEFSLIIEGTNDIHKITTIADDILSSIAEPYFIRNQEIALTCSIGIAMFPDDGSNSHELLKNADTAMYHAKDKGGDTYQFFNDSMNKQAVKRLQIENLIRHGLKEDLFSVYYQPKIDVQNGGVKGMEALVRFEAGDKGLIRPDIFIPISEETGQIIDIGEIVLRKACIATKAWLDNGIFKGRIAVNLSAVQFRQPNLVKVISDILEETKLPAKHLELEITEGTVMDSPQQAIETMLQIRKMGINLSLDDFGTGYSSLAYLKKFPLNTLKIDKAFVDDIELSEEGRNMVATIITIAHNLGMNVVAEGVENEKQLDYLRTLRCEQLQGYLYSKPLNEEDFGRYLISHIITQKSTPYTSLD